MAIDYTVLFDRIGKGIYVLNLVNEFNGGTINSGAIATDLPTEWQDFVEQYDGAAANLRGALGDAVGRLNSAINASSTIPLWIAEALGNTIIETVNDDNPLTAMKLENGLADLIKAMRTGVTQTIDANAVTITATAWAGNTGNGYIVVSSKDGSGKTLEYMYDETLDLSFTSTSSPGAESATVLGESKAANMLAPSWPLGSGANKTLSSVNSADTGLVLNGTFDNFAVPNTPDSWTIVVGVPGTGILQELSVVYKGANALRFFSDGATLYRIEQVLDTAQLKSKTPYAINFFARMSAAPATGGLEVDLYDGAITVLSDEAGASNTFTVNLPTLGTSYVACSGVFRLRDPMPATVVLRIRVTTAIENAKSLYIDHMALQEMTQLYPGGPYIAIFSGAVNWSLDDVFSLVVTNDYGGALQTAFWRMFDMPAKGLIVPSNATGSETISDTVIA